MNISEIKQQLALYTAQRINTKAQLEAANAAPESGHQPIRGFHKYKIKVLIDFLYHLDKIIQYLTKLLEDAAHVADGGQKN